MVKASAVVQSEAESLRNGGPLVWPPSWVWRPKNQERGCPGAGGDAPAQAEREGPGVSPPFHSLRALSRLEDAHPPVGAGDLLYHVGGCPMPHARLFPHRRPGAFHQPPRHPLAQVRGAAGGPSQRQGRACSLMWLAEFNNKIYIFINGYEFLKLDLFWLAK